MALIEKAAWPHLHVQMAPTSVQGTYSLTLSSTGEEAHGLRFVSFGSLDEFDATVRQLQRSIAECRQLEREAAAHDGTR